jgi:Cu+-exporting ATPase
MAQKDSVYDGDPAVAGQARRTTAEHPGKGIEGWIDNRHLRLGSAAWLRECGLDVPDLGNVRVWLSEDRKVLGGYTFNDNLREGMAESLPRLGKGYDLNLLTGDRASGLEQLQEWIPGFRTARAELSPADKLQAIDELRKDGRAVMMVGDGLNDAGALRHSDVGVAVAEDVQSFSPACDAILDAGALNRMPSFLHFSRHSMKVVGVCFAISLFYNAAGIAWAASGHLSPLVAAILMPLSSVSVLLVSVGGTKLAAKLAGLSESGRSPLGPGSEARPSTLGPEGVRLQTEAAA